MCLRFFNHGRHNSKRQWLRPESPAKRGIHYARWVALPCVFSLYSTASALSLSDGPSSTPSIFNPTSTPAHDIYHLSLFVMAICLAIFLVVFSLIVYAAVKFRSRVDDGSEPPQIYGSN